MAHGPAVVVVLDVVVLRDVHGVLTGAQTVPGVDGGVQSQSDTLAHVLAVRIHAPKAGVHQYVQEPPQPGGGGGGGGGGVYTHAV